MTSICCTTTLQHMYMKSLGDNEEFSFNNICNHMKHENNSEQVLYYSTTHH
jgi:hypothetical protein